MYALRILIATSDPYHLLMAGYALGGICMASAYWFINRPKVARALDRLHRSLWGYPECGRDGCYCRRSCLWALGIDPQGVPSHG